MSDADEDLIVEAEERLCALFERAWGDAGAILREAEAEAEQIRREVLERTGVQVIEPAPPKVPAVMDVVLSDLAVLAERCGYLLAGAEPLAPYAKGASDRTVGALLKTRVDTSTGVRVLDHLRRSGFFAAEEGTS